MWRCGTWPQVTLATAGHRAAKEETIDQQLRLDTQNLLDLATQLSSAIDKAKAGGWGEEEMWQPFLADVETVALGLDKLGDGGLENARRSAQAKERTEPARSPADPNHLRVEVVEPATPKDVRRYERLHSELLAAKDYEPVLITDVMMGISRLTSTPSNHRRSFLAGMCFPGFTIKYYAYRPRSADSTAPSSRSGC